jgi:hypothetical protein
VRKSDDGTSVILASGTCPFCGEPIHIMCDLDKVGESTKIEEGRVVAVLCRTFAHPEPWCARFDQATKKGKGFWKWLWRKAAIKIDPTPVSEALN